MESRTEDGSQEAWNPTKHAIWIDPDDKQGLTIRHPAFPFKAPWRKEDGWNGLAAIAWNYLQQIATHLPLTPNRLDAATLWRDAPADWLEDLAPGSLPKPERPNLRWLAFDPGDPRHSFWVGGEPAEGRIATGRSVVLLACLAWPCVGKPGENVTRQPLFGGQGLRVVAHVGPIQDGAALVRITGVSSTLPRLGEHQLAKFKTLFGGSTEYLWTLVKQLREQDLIYVCGSGSPNEEVIELGLRITEDLALEVRARTRSSGPESDGLVHELVTRVGDQTESGKPPSPEIGRRRPLSAFAAAMPLKGFDLDPASCVGSDDWWEVRPYRDSEMLKALMPRVPGLGASGETAEHPLRRRDHFKVTHSVFTESDAREIDKDPSRANTAKKVRVADCRDPHREDRLDLRSHGFGAVSAHHQATNFFDRLKRYGLALEECFPFAELPLLIRYRAGITPGPGKDGRVVNAQVRWIDPPRIENDRDDDASPDAGDASPPPGNDGTGDAGTTMLTLKRGSLEVRFALGDLASSTIRKPLCVACDPRWNWHEFGHVLLAAATGELEFRFAHSAGDALGAILSDPKSKLASEAGWRGLSFPWIFLPRRHDRAVEEGWGWSGSLYLEETGRDGSHVAEAHGYRSEQILSSSLFRLYRAMGGDAGRQGAPAGPAQADTETREAAADYTIYLIMRAIALLGPASVVPAPTPDHFVSALVDADVGTVQFGDFKHRRNGGTAHKAIRWAFEQQGLYVDPSRTLPVDEPGEAEPVDLHIDDGAGGHYAGKGAEAFDPMRSAGLWMRMAKDGVEGHQEPGASSPAFVYVKVRNRGAAEKAEHVRVSVWRAPLEDSGEAPAWHSAEWEKLEGDAAAAVAVDALSADRSAVFGSFVFPSAPRGKRFALLAVATCEADRANVEAETGLPCAQPEVRCPIAPLVRGDNNLGLRIVTVA